MFLSFIWEPCWRYDHTQEVLPELCSCGVKLARWVVRTLWWYFCRTGGAEYVPDTQWDTAGHHSLEGVWQFSPEHFSFLGLLFEKDSFVGSEEENRHCGKSLTFQDFPKLSWEGSRWGRHSPHPSTFKPASSDTRWPHKQCTEDGFPGNRLLDSLIEIKLEYHGTLPATVPTTGMGSTIPRTAMERAVECGLPVMGPNQDRNQRHSRNLSLWHPSYWKCPSQINLNPHVKVQVAQYTKPCFQWKKITKPSKAKKHKNLKRQSNH